MGHLLPLTRLARLTNLQFQKLAKLKMGTPAKVDTRGSEAFVSKMECDGRLWNKAGHFGRFDARSSHAQTTLGFASNKKLWMRQKACAIPTAAAPIDLGDWNF